MIPLLEAQRRVAALPLTATPHEEVALESSVGRVLARAPESDRELPPFDRVTMDGFAVRSGDVVAGRGLTLIGTLAAGGVAARPLAAGEALRIMTGAPLPEGADAVVPIEEARVGGDAVWCERHVVAGQNIHRRGVDLKRGERPLAAGSRLTPATLPLLATLGCRRATVHRRPIVALLATGDELVEPDVRPTGGQIRESNRFALAAQVHSAGGEPRLWPIVRDDPDELRRAIDAAQVADVVVVTGGSSVGDFDFSRPVVESLGGKLWFDQVAIKPGKPVLLFTLETAKGGDAASGTGARSVPVVCLPGNPVSSFVTFELLVRPLLERISGATACWPIAESQITSAPIAAPSERDLLQLSRIVASGLSAGSRVAVPGWRIEPVRWSGSGDLVAIARANALVHVPRATRAEAGESVKVLRFATAMDDLPRATEPQP